MPKRKPKGVSQLKKDVWKVFSRYVRYRDALLTTGKPEYILCITCGKRKNTKSVDAGHFITCGKEPTRFDERNVHGQCKHCNAFEDKIKVSAAYEKAMIGMYGKKQVDELKALSNQLKRWTKKELLELLAFYKEELKSMEKEYGKVWK